MVVLLILGVPWNATNFDNGVFGPSYMDRTQAILTNAVRVPGAGQVPADIRPIREPLMPRGVDMGFLRQAAADGKLDAPSTPARPVVPQRTAAARWHLAAGWRGRELPVYP